MESMLQEIYMHKNKLMNLINNLINTQLINEEININNEIKKVSEFLNSLLNIKQNFLMNQINQNNNINLNFIPFMPQLNPMMNAPEMNLNMNQLQFNPQQINNNIDNYNENFLDLFFFNTETCKTTTVNCNKKDKISEVIEKYKIKANDHNNNKYIWNAKLLNESLNSTVINFGLCNQAKIDVCALGQLKGGP